MKRTVLVTALVLMLVLLCAFASAEGEIASGKCGLRANWTLDAGYNLKITGSGTMSDYNLTDNIAPWMAYKDQIKTVEIGGTVTYVGAYTFRDCKALTQAVFNDSVEKIGNYAFEMCTALAKADLPPKLTSIGAEAFSECSLTELNIPATVTYISVAAFEENDFETISYPGTVTSKNGNIFQKCEKLRSVTLGEGITTLGYAMFYGCSALEEVHFPSTLQKIGEKAFNNCILTDIDLPEGLTEIGPYAFSKNKLTNFKLPSTLTTLGTCAFWSNSENSNDVGDTLVIPASLKVVSNSAFEDTFFKKIIIEEGVTSLEAGCFGSFNKHKNVKTQIDVPASVTQIEDGWYGGSDVLYTPNGSTYVYQWATAHMRHVCRLDAPFNFYNENGEILLTKYTGRDPEVTIPKAIDGTPVTMLMPLMFTNNPYYGTTPFITRLQLPDASLLISNSALNNLKDGCEVHIPAGVDQFETGCLGGGNHVIYTTTNSPAHKHWIGGDDNVTLILTDMKGSTPYTYKVNGSNCTITGYYSTEKVIEIPSEIDGYKVTAIGNGAFHGTCVQEVTIPSSVTKIGDLAFCYVQQPAKFIARIPTSVKTIGDTAFPYEEGAVLLVEKNSAAHKALKKTNKKQVKIWDGENFSYETFKFVIAPDEYEMIILINGYWGTGRGDVTVPSKIEGKRVARLGGWNDYDAMQVVFPASRPINNLIIPKSVEETIVIIEKGAVKNIYTPDLKYKFSSLWVSAPKDTVFHVYPDSDWHKFVEEMGYNYRFVMDYVKFQLPGALKNVQAEAFMGDGSLEYVVIPDSAKTIGENAFKNCSNLQRVEFIGMETEIGNGAFENCHADFVILCKSGSKAEEYAKSKSIKYEIIQ